MNICQYQECNNECKNKYCSLSCGTKQQHINNPPIKKQNMVTCNAPNCEVQFNAIGGKRLQKYCSRSCSASVNNIGVTRHGAKAKNCLWCNERLARSQNKYCSHDHHSKYVEKEKLNNWLNGWNPPYYALPKVIRKFLLEESGYRCTSPTCCVKDGWSGINPRSGKTCLTIDHIDGNADNNLRESLRVLCPNCHSLTPTFGGLNRGNGRSRRYASLSSKVD